MLCREPGMVPEIPGRVANPVLRRPVPCDVDTPGVDADDRPPICATCGVTMVPAALSASDDCEGDWVCLECEELDGFSTFQQATPQS